jgi:hypothetical protein
VTNPERARRSLSIRLLFLAGLALLCAAPTPGDVGGCGQQPQPLDAGLFFLEKARIDCAQCGDCGYRSEHCSRACSGELPQTAFPEGCEPLVHDGEVCLRALEAAGCGEYEDYVKDAGRLAPSECLFCPWSTP